MGKKVHIRATKAPQAKGYSDAGASYTRRATKGFLAKSGAPVEDIDSNNYTLRQRSRMLYMSSPVATAAINTNRTKIVGTGLTLRCTIDRDVLGLTPDAAREWQRKTEAEFAMWAGKKQNCDALGLNNFAAIQQLVVKSWLMSGDVFVLIKRAPATKLNPYTLRLHVIEADRVSTPDFCGTHISYPLATEGKVPAGMPGAGHKVHDGVEVDENGRIVAYYICNTHPFQLIADKREWVRVLAYGEDTGLPNILHIMDSERPDQYRGVPYLAQVIEPLLQLRRYTESELMAALVQSFFTAWITTGTEQPQIPFNETGAGDVAGVPSSNPDEISESENEYEMGPGSVAHLEPGEQITFGNPNIPTAGFEAFVKTFCRLVGAALELPYDVLIKEFNASYSASRGALLEAYEAFKMRREWLTDDLCRPVYEIFLAEAVARGRIVAPGFFVDPLVRNAWCGAMWIGPAQVSLDPKKETEAAILQVNNGFKTRTQVTRELGGGDYTENVEQLAQENTALDAAGGNRAATVLEEPDNDDDGGNAGEGGT